MKRIFYFIFFLISLNLSAQTRYVATDGNDAGAGTIGDPYLTWQKGVDETEAGDTLYIRGGVYYPTTTVTISGLNGTLAEPTCIFNYPNETPILDGINKTTTSDGFYVHNCNHIKVRGLEIRNHYQHGIDENVAGFPVFGTGTITIDRLVVHDIGRRGFEFYNVDTIYCYNTDAYACEDSLMSVPGNGGDGFIMMEPSQSDTTDYALFKGCRSWDNSDDGFDVHTNGLIEFDSCWAFIGGRSNPSFEGNGFKLGLSITLERDMVSRRVTNCITAYNDGNGVTANDGLSVAVMPQQWYNNTSVYNKSAGFRLFATNDDQAQEEKRVLINNAAYGNDTDFAHSGYYTATTNSWDTPPDITLTDADFTNVDSTTVIDQLLGARQSDGSLPVITVLRPSPNSQLIDAGTYVGLDYNGNAPDLGYHEFEPMTSQTIQLLTGWNMHSFIVEPESTDMLDIHEDLINAGTLNKIVDGDGAFVQNVPGLGWMNTIGDMVVNQGYYIKVDETTQIDITGQLSGSSCEIPLNQGWNIMGYPISEGQDALTAVQPLIDNDELIKVICENGGFIQEIQGIGWINTIGNFMPGEGYYIQATTNTSFTLNCPMSSNMISYTEPALETVLFENPNPKNPYMLMNIIVNDIRVTNVNVQEGDEIAVYDNDIIVGTGVITSLNGTLFTLIVAAMDDPTTEEIDGFTEGNSITFRYLNAQIESPIEMMAEAISGSNEFTALGTYIVSLQDNLTHLVEHNAGNMNIKTYPNPVHHMMSVDYTIPQGQTYIGIMNLSGSRIMEVMNEFREEGDHTSSIDISGLSQGLYVLQLRVVSNGMIYTKFHKFVK